MNIKTPVNIVGYGTHHKIKDANNELICGLLNYSEAAELASIINLHGELVDFLKLVVGPVGTIDEVSQCAASLLAKCEQIGKGETP